MQKKLGEWSEDCAIGGHSTSWSKREWWGSTKNACPPRVEGWSTWKNVGVM